MFGLQVTEVAFDLTDFSFSSDELWLVCHAFNSHILFNQSHAIVLSDGHELIQLVLEVQFYSESKLLVWILEVQYEIVHSAL